jgi:hypothetical protein
MLVGSICRESGGWKVLKLLSRQVGQCSGADFALQKSTLKLVSNLHGLVARS